MNQPSNSRDYGVGALARLLLLVLILLAAWTLISCASSDPTTKQLLIESSEAPASNLSPEGVDPWISPNRTERIRQLTGRFDPIKDTAFVKLHSRYTDGEQDYWVRRQTATAVVQMIEAAANDQVQLVVRSATRNFDRQSQIWGAKWRGERTLSNGVNLATANLSDSAKARMILLYSSMPGTSRHHWGTDIDFNAFENDYFATVKGLQEYNWLQEHAAEFGFYQPYTSKDSGRTGYEEEKWHWSYKPLSQNLLQVYKAEIGYEDISGFDGAAFAKTVHAIEEYVLGVGSGLNE